MSSEANIALLRRFEPLIRYTRGEQFFPMDVERYVRACSLWMQKPDEEAVCLTPEGQLSVEKLSEPRVGSFGAITFLKFIEPLNITEMAAYTLQETLKRKYPRDVFRAGRGRLARVGYLSRFVDALFSLTLLARGRVPGDTAAAAVRTYRKMLAEDERYCYHGRVVRQGGWIALQYWFFYPFNNWRSGFHGVNDHESDWEMITIYLSETEGEARPAWVAYASHDFSGDDLRRRWDDPELEKVGEHPLIYAGAGSHASYYARGEYLAELELPFLAPLVRVVDGIQDFWRKRLQKNKSGQTEQQPTFNIFRVPFVDYARGDGLSIGLGGDKTWDTPCLLDPAPEWAIQYRGLWGLYARDPIAGENAPAGPIYNRDGSERRSWYDPLGWAGLDKVPPPHEALSLALEQCREIESRQAAAETAIAEKNKTLLELGIQTEAMIGQPHLASLHGAYRKKMAALSDEIKALRAQSATDQGLLAALKQHAESLQRGERGPARAHIHRAHHPASDAGIRLNRFAETWSAISIGLMMLGFVGIVLFARHYLFLGLTAMISIIVFVEAGFRRQLSRLITSLTIGLAVVAALILLYEFFWSIIVVGVIIAGSYIMWENIRELRA
jgi:hypothetical protein